MFSRLLEKIFKGFNIGADTQIIERLVEEGKEEVFIVKKSHYYITLMTLPTIITIILISVINGGLLFYTELFPERTQWALAILLGLNMLIWFTYIIKYLQLYNKNYGIFKIMTAKEWLPILKNGDTTFRNFFNQTIFLILVYILIVVFFIVETIIFSTKINRENGLILGGNVILFIIQFHQIVYLLRRFINLEMDFSIITKDHIKHYDQINFGIQTKSMDVDKIKTIRSNKTGMLKSILNYGEVNVFTDGDTQSEADLSLQYIKKPETVEKLLNDIKTKI